MNPGIGSREVLPAFDPTGMGIYNTTSSLHTSSGAARRGMLKQVAFVA